MPDERTHRAAALMASFAERTGLTSSRPERRYLWTDAFAVCNFIALGRATGDARYAGLATRLVDRVHHVLGRHRPDDTRSGWISGLGEAEGEAHPTLGGLRIGKPLPERAPGESIDERIEWDRDGQYFHYLTKWVHALDRLAHATDDAKLDRWAGELADTAHRRFAYAAAGGTRMYWKMSIDLTRPLVRSMGQHDPLDGLLTYLELDTGAAAGDSPIGGPGLSHAIADYARMIEPGSLATADPLGIGGLLVDAFRLAGLIGDRATREAMGSLLDAILAAAALGLDHYVGQPDLGLRSDRRLAFRELGLAIGLAALTRIDRERLGVETRRHCAKLDHHARLRDEIEAFWLEPAHRETRTWLDHADINDVMLATSLVPDGFLRPPAS